MTSLEWFESIKNKVLIFRENTWYETICIIKPINYVMSEDGIQVETIYESEKVANGNWRIYQDDSRFRFATRLEIMYYSSLA